MLETQPRIYKLYDLSEDLISQICDFFFAQPLMICYPFPALSCISCSDYTSLISLVHTNSKLRDLVRNNTDLWSRCLFRFPCFLDRNLKCCQKLMVKCDEKYSNLTLPTYASYLAAVDDKESKNKVGYYMGEVSSSDVYNEGALELVKEGKISSSSGATTGTVEEKRNRTTSCYSCESELIDSYSEFINVLCDTASMDIYFEGFNPSPLELHKRKETQVQIRKYHEKFPHIRCATFRQQKGYLEGDYWFNTDIKFEKKRWWHEMEGIVVSYESFFSLQDILKRNFLSKIMTRSEKNEMKRVNMTINLGEGKSNILLKNITKFVEECGSNIQVMTTVFALEPQCFSVLYQHLKRVSLSMKSEPGEEIILLKDISLPHLTWLDLHGQYKQGLNPITQAHKLHHIKFDNVDMPMLFNLESNYFELSVENQKVFPKLKTFKLQYSKFRKDFFIDKHYDSLVDVTLAYCVEIFTEKLDLYLDSKFHKLEKLHVSEARNIQVLDLPKLDNVQITSSLTFHAKDCKLKTCYFNLIAESVNIEQPNHPISSYFNIYNNPEIFSLTAPSCKALTMYVQNLNDQTCCEINVGEINHYSANISCNNTNDTGNFSIFPNACKIDTLDLSIRNNNLFNFVAKHLKQLSSIRKIKFSHMTPENVRQFYPLISELANEYAVSESSSNNGLYIHSTRTLLSDVALEATSDPMENMLHTLLHPGLTEASITIYPEKKTDPVITSSTLKSLSLTASGKQSLIYIPLDFQKLSSLESLSISYQTMFTNSATSILKKLTVSTSQTVEIDLSLLPLLTNLNIHTCKNLKLHCSKEISNSKLAFININLIDTMNAELPSWSLLAAKEVSILKIKNTTENTLLDFTDSKCRIKIVHLPEKHLLIK